MLRRKGTKNFFSLLLVALFCWHMGSITLFPHVHIIDGVNICHSHPFTGTSDNSGHSHSQTQFETIAQLSLALFLLAVVLGMISVIAATQNRAVLRLVLQLYGISVPVPRLRGPPRR